MVSLAEESRSSRPLRLFVSAAEVSSDIHAAALIRALSQKLESQGRSLEVFGIGGAHLQAAGLRPIFDARELLAMGFSEVLGRLPRLYRALQVADRSIRVEKPDVILVLDYGEFHFKLAKRLSRLNIPKVYYIPPKVWVWRKGRIQTLKKLFDQVLCILPFEERIFRDAGLPAAYVGNPLVDELPLDLSRDEARKRLGVANDQKLFAIFPGSRPAEWKQHIPVMVKAAQRMQERSSDRIQFWIVLPEGLETQEVIHEAKELAGSTIDLRIESGKSHELMVAADAGWVKSGTSTLEAALLRLPHGVVYKTTKLTSLIFRYLVRYKGPVGLANLVLGSETSQKGPIHEILLENVTVDSLVQEGEELLRDDGRRQALAREFEEVRRRILGERASDAAAASILKIVDRKSEEE